jgi:hypothetical protein
MIPATIAIVTFSAFSGVVWLAYEQGVDRGLQLSPPLIRAESGPVKIPPQDAGGLQVPNQDRQVFDVLVAEAPDRRIEQLLPPPDEPLPAPEPEPPLTALDPGAEIAIAELPVAEPLLEPAPEAEPEIVPRVFSWAGHPEALLEPAEAPAPESAAEPQLVAEPLVPLVAVPAPEPAAEPQLVAEPLVPLVAAPAPEVAAVAQQEQGLGAGLLASYRIQLGSLRNKDAALVAWDSILKTNPGILEGLEPLVRQADLGDRGIFYRLQAGPLESSIVAIALCDALKAKNVDCLVISP